MTTIHLAQELGTHLSSRTTGATLRRRIESAVALGQTVTVDWTGVDTVADSFADEAFAVLVEAHGPDWFKRGVHMHALDGVLRDTVLGTVLERRRRHMLRAG
ncbi:STAS-like domain-containing protein [Chondromyces apiculatus]|uniref:DUF4325 domain-containing protein n=1 Tax=Chondromyces apiculatus DSM 436 TaxID=1192034 RepID=A0A017T3H7_9BACT|nr:STAS-like domain-containing protein [Chondromyces apiculatus]EYF03400.1 Hypothetical protein CAP_5593 [Chondromyces apiculatus DSM 436]